MLEPDVVRYGTPMLLAANRNWWFEARRLML
jgi:hypothetical protein